MQRLTGKRQCPGQALHLAALQALPQHRLAQPAGSMHPQPPSRFPQEAAAEAPVTLEPHRLALVLTFRPVRADDWADWADPAGLVRAPRAHCRTGHPSRRASTLRANWMKPATSPARQGQATQQTRAEPQTHLQEQRERLERLERHHPSVPQRQSAPGAAPHQILHHNNRSAPSLARPRIARPRP